MEFFSNPLHLFLLIVVIVLLFGANKIGDVGGALGKSIREFKKEATKEEENLTRRRVQTPPTAGYVPPAPGYTVQQPPVSEPQRPVAPPPMGDYRPPAPAQPLPPSSNVPPEYPGR